MKQDCLELLENLREDNVDLLETPVLFNWSYVEEPKIRFSLLIEETEESNINALHIQ